MSMVIEVSWQKHGGRYPGDNSGAWEASFRNDHNGFDPDFRGLKMRVSQYGKLFRWVVSGAEPNGTIKSGQTTEGLGMATQEVMEAFAMIVSKRLFTRVVVTSSGDDGKV
jgi:hypothetical protein